ncbi:hypothetical protein Bbelb_070250 [Branchiostoma belcheri]|nr:hypothetical protein Bbelb_070250 [Branchiostoma belcheri]
MAHGRDRVDQLRWEHGNQALKRVSLTFLSKNNASDKGGKLTSVTGCGGNLTAPSGGPVTSPNYPGNYRNNENCEWAITVPEGSIIRLTFDNFHTEGDFDYLTIYDGASDNATEIKR